MSSVRKWKTVLISLYRSKESIGNNLYKFRFIRDDIEDKNFNIEEFDLIFQWDIGDEVASYWNLWFFFQTDSEGNVIAKKWRWNRNNISNPHRPLPKKYA